MRPSDRCARPVPRRCGGRSIRARSAAGVRTRCACSRCSKSWKRVLHPQGRDGPNLPIGCRRLVAKFQHSEFAPKMRPATGGSPSRAHPQRRRFVDARTLAAERSMSLLGSSRQAARQPFLLNGMAYMPQRSIDRRSRSFGSFAATFGSTLTPRTEPFATDSTRRTAYIGGSSTRCTGWIFRL